MQAIHELKRNYNLEIKLLIAFSYFGWRLVHYYQHLAC